jgi:hypothetical protein
MFTVIQYGDRNEKNVAISARQQAFTMALVEFVQPGILRFTVPICVVA